MSFTKSDKQFLKENFASKDDLKDLRSQITDDIDGKLKIKKREILSEMDKKLAKQKDEIVNSVAKDIVETIVPLIDEQDKKIAGIQKKIGLSPLNN